MFKTFPNRARWLAVATGGLLIQDKLHGLSLGRWVYLVAVLFGLAVVAVVATWDPAQRLAWWRKPMLEMLGVSQYVRTAQGSASAGANDLHVVYARIRNAKTRGASFEPAEAWMTVLDANKKEIGDGCSGNWLDLSEGTPKAETVKVTKIRPTREVVGLELMAKFDWQDIAWLAGEHSARLGSGTYRIRASISNGKQKPTVFEWEVTNPGKNGVLRSPGLPHVGP